MSDRPRRRLYHLTNAQNAVGILRGEAILTAAELRERGENVFQPLRDKWDRLNESVVWLTRNPAPRQGWQVGDLKWQVRITVEVADALPWRRFALREGIPRRYQERLAGAGDPAEWWIVQRPLPMGEWLSVERTDTMEVLWRPGLPTPTVERACVQLEALHDEAIAQARRAGRLREL